MDGNHFAAFIMPRYGFRKEAADSILSYYSFVLLNPNSQTGGGRVDNLNRVVIFDTAQHEAAVHELAHAWFHLCGNHLTPKLISAFLYNADADKSKYTTIRNLCHVYKYGSVSAAFAGMWVGYPYFRYNEEEIFAGIASKIMGNIHWLPPDLREIYDEMFLGIIYMPVMTNYTIRE